MSYQELLFSPLIPPKIVPLVEKASQTSLPVLILGEPGTGKDLVAKVIHHTGAWKNQRFYRVDCKFLAEETWVHQLHSLLKEVDYGAQPTTFYFKEVGALEPMSQLRLLELLEDGIFQNGGEKKEVKHLRFISSSSEDLRSKVAQRKFSGDLYDRLSPLSISIPPLRQRTQEIPAIAEYILADCCKKTKVKKLSFSSEALKILESYWWPGNLRELEHLVLRSAVLSEGEKITEQDLFFQIEQEKHPFLSILKKGEIKIPASPREKLPQEGQAPPLPLFFIDLVHRIKNPLVSIKTFTQLLREKFDDSEFRDYFYRIVTEDIEKIDQVLNGLLSYIKINTPIKKANTVNTILEEVIKKHEAELGEKKVRIVRKFEKDLPETIVHDEQLRYILESIVKYALPSIPPEGTIGFLTKSARLALKGGTRERPSEANGHWVEILVVFTGCKKLSEPYERALGISSFRPQEAIELEMRLVKEIIDRNQGKMTFQVNDKKSRTLVSLRFPVERRNVFYYPSGSF